MKLKTPKPVAAALMIASLAPTAIAETVGQHPAEVVARTWSTRGVDANTFVVGPAVDLQRSTSASTSAKVGGTAHSTPSLHAFDAQAQAAALLSPHLAKTPSGNGPLHSLSSTRDAQASAAALLSASRVAAHDAAEAPQSPDGRVLADARAHAAALLSGPSALTVARHTRELNSKVKS